MILNSKINIAIFLAQSFIFVKASDNIRNIRYNLQNQQNWNVEHDTRFFEKQINPVQAHQNYETVRNNLVYTHSHQDKSIPLYKQQIEDGFNCTGSNLLTHSECLPFYPPNNSDLALNNIGNPIYSKAKKYPIERRTVIENIFRDRINDENNEEINSPESVEISYKNSTNSEEIKIIENNPHHSSSFLYDQEHTRFEDSKPETITSNQNEINAPKSTIHYFPTSITNQETNDILSSYKTYLEKLSCQLDEIEIKTTLIESGIMDIINILKDKREVNRNTKNVILKNNLKRTEMSKIKRSNQGFDEDNDEPNNLKKEKYKKLRLSTHENERNND